MRSFFNMVGFEYKKIFKRKGSTIALIIVSILMIISPVLILIGNTYVGGEVYESHYESMVIERDYARALSGRYIDETLLLEAQEAASKMPPVGKDESYINIPEYHEYYRPYSGIYSIVYDIYGTGNPMMKNINNEQMKNFYEIRHDIIKDNINKLNISQKSKDKLINLDSKIKTPFEFSYTGAYERILNLLLTTGLFATFAIAICLSPIFAGEYGTRTDQLILSSKFGKNKLILAKLFTGLSFSSGFCLLMIIVTYLSSTFIYGTDGGNAPLQLYYLYGIYPITLLQTTVIMSMCVFFASILTCVITLLLSSLFKSPFGVIIIISILLFLPPMFFVSGDNMLIYNIHRTLPSSMMEFWTIIVNCEPYEILGLSILPYIFVPIFTTLTSTLILPFAYRSFKNHQIG